MKQKLFSHQYLLGVVMLVVFLATSVSASVIRVKWDSPVNGPGSDWSNAYRTVTAAINAAQVNNEIWVARGTYMGCITLKSGVALYGGFAGVEFSRNDRNWNLNKSILDGSGTGKVVYANNCSSATILDGFIVGYGNDGVYCEKSSLYIANNTIIGNSSHGTYIGDRSCPSVYNNVIKGNGQNGIYIYSGLSPLLINNTISGNGNYGIYNYFSSPHIMNNIIAFNGQGIYNESSSPVLNNNCVYNPGGTNYEGLKAGKGDIAVDPKFASAEYGRLHIQPDSPCVNNGLNNVVQPDWKDMDCQNRILDNQVDIGADESDGSFWSALPVIIHVDPNGSDGNDGSSWALAKRTVQAAINTTHTVGGEVWVASGIYVEHPVLKSYVNLYGGFAGNESVRNERNWVVNRSIIDGNGSSTVITGGKGNQVNTLDGFIIRNGVNGITCLSSSMSIINNSISGNSGHGIQYVYYYSNASITNNTISGNGRYGIYSYSYASVSIINNTISDNTEGGIYCGYYANPSIKNNIVAFNGKGIFNDSCVPILNNNCVYNPNGTNYVGLSAGDGDIFVDPLFVSIKYGRYHIQPNSPCIDKGLNSVVSSNWTDIDGQNRILGASVDIGADESDGTAWSILPVVVRVSPSGLDGNDGSSWALAKRTIQAGIDAASVSGGEVWVAAGTYTGSIALQPHTYLYGGFAGIETSRDDRNWFTNKSILDGNGVIYIVIGNRESHYGALDGFTIKNGDGGIYLFASISIANNTILGNNCGIYCQRSSPTIINNIISGNKYLGISCSSSSSPFIINNTITGSDKGIYCQDSDYPSITNNIIAFNGCGIYRHNSAEVPITKNNCIYNPGGTDFTGLTADATDILVDPMFVNKDAGNFHIMPGSPCIDAGNDSYIQPGWTDMDGEVRIQGAHVDIGADESTVPKMYTLSANVELGDYFGLLEGIPVTIELLVGGEIKRTERTTLDAEGKFYIQNVEPGTYDVGIKPSHWLRKVVAGVTVVDGDLDFVIR